jgi:hypothetical protein
MRAPPPLHVDAGGGPGWRAARAGLAGAAAGVPLAWAAPWLVAGIGRWPLSLVVSEGAARAVAGVPAIALNLAAAAVALAASLGRWRGLSRQERTTPPACLRWDGTAWSLVAAPGATAVPGSVSLALDLGGWMLVRFHADESAGPRASAWLALRPSRGPAHWCAVRAALWTWRAEARPVVR